MGRKTKFQDQKSKHKSKSNRTGHNLLEASENKRDVVQNEVLQYLQRAGSSKLWTQREEDRSDSRQPEGNPFRDDSASGCKWESFSTGDTADKKLKRTFAGLSSADRQNYKKVITKCISKQEGPPNLEQVVYMLTQRKIIEMSKTITENPVVFKKSKIKKNKE